MKFFKETDEIVDESKLLETIKYNKKVASDLRKKIREFDAYESFSPVYSQDIKHNLEDEISEESNSEFDYYYQDIFAIKEDLSDDEIKKKIRESLPSKQNLNFDSIIMYIKYRMENEILEYLSFADENLSKEEYMDLKRIILFLEKKKGFIDSIINEVATKECEEKKNNIIFLESRTGRVYPIDDLDSIPNEYYDAFYELYKSIENGTFKNVKRFTGKNDSIYGVSEVRGNGIRIIFDRLDKDTYIILQAFVKKTNSDSIYVSSITTRFAKYKAKESEILKNLEEEKEKNIKSRKEFERMLLGKNKRLG